MITINSTSGLSALHHGVPLAVLGQALYRHPELAFCVERGMDLDRFWLEGKAAPENVRHRYLSWIHHECLAGGDFYAKDAMAPAIEALRRKIDAALEEKRPAKDAGGVVSGPERRLLAASGADLLASYFRSSGYFGWLCSAGRVHVAVVNVRDGFALTQPGMRHHSPLFQPMSICCRQKATMKRSVCR
jgi:hypothetical protein